MSVKTIKNLEALVSSFVSPGYSFVNAKLRKLTSSGDNYGSLLLAVDILVKNEHKEEEHIYAVAKKLPSNELVQKMFNSQRTFPNEVGFYQTIIPCLTHFQKQQTNTNTNFCPDFYASQMSQIDDTSVLLIKNIKKEGFDILDRTVGFDLSQSRLILEKMAELHTTVIALKSQKPQIFEEKLAPFLEEFEIFVMDEETNDKMIKRALEVVSDETCRKYLPQLEEIMKKSSVVYPTKNDRSVLQNPFFTLVHSDLWTNNIMVKIVNDKITDVKFVDYQLIEYTSLTRDVVFFIFSSVKLDVLKQHCDDLLLYYFESFIQCLKRLHCKTEDFSFGGFLEDMKIMVKQFEFFHIMTMLPPIFATSKDTKDVEQLEMDSFVFAGSEVTDEYTEKACFIVKDFIRRSWLP